MGATIQANSSGKSGKRTPLPEPEINVTPLVDVVLVLLIIFMVIAPQLENGQRVELPAIVRPDPKQKGKLDPVTVTLTADGTLFVEKEAVFDLPLLKEKLAALHVAAPERRVVLKGDASLSYLRVREVFRTVGQSGFEGCALVVSKKGRGGEDSDGESSGGGGG